MSGRRIGCCATLVLFALVALLGMGDAGARVRATLVVSPGGTVPGSFSSIQTAVNTAASGDTILVNPGTSPYTEQVTINKNLTLQANGSGVVIKAPSTLTADTLGVRAIVEVNSAATVNIRGLTIQGPVASGQIIDAGVVGVGGATLNLDGNTIENIRSNPLTEVGNTGYAVQVGGSASAAVGQVGHVTATGNRLVDYQKGGFVVGGVGSTGTIEHNTVIGVGPTPTIAQNGIQVLPGVADVEISDNDVAGKRYTGTQSVSASGILLSGAGQVKVAGNTLHENQVGIDLSSQSAHVTVAHNELFDGDRGIELFKTSGADILANASVRAVAGGIVAEDSSGNTLVRNSAAGAQPGHADCLDNSTGSESAGTGNTWRANVGASSSPKDLCSPGPITTIDLDPAAPGGPGVVYTRPVRVIVSASSAGGSAVTGTRCVLDPPSPPTRFRDLPAGLCPYLGPGADVSALGHHTVYAASVNAAGVTDAAVRSTSFTITTPPLGADLAVSKTGSTDTVHPGGQLTYQLVVRNHGPGEATGVAVRDPSPPGLVFQHVESSAGVQCKITGELGCALGTLAAGEEALIQVTATVAADATGTIVNQATVFGSQEDPNLANNTATSTVQVTPSPGTQPVSDLRIQLRDPRVGQRHTFTITVTNHGPDPAGGVLVTFTASLPLRIVPANAVRDRCTTTLPVRCELGTLAVGDRVTLRIVAVPRVPGVLRATAAVMSNSRDPTPHNTVATAAATILPARTPTPAPPPFTG